MVSGGSWHSSWLRVTKCRGKSYSPNLRGIPRRPRKPELSILEFTEVQETPPKKKPVPCLREVYTIQVSLLYPPQPPGAQPV
jgi:hypothetical protein